MERIQKISNWFVIVSACSHFFCCVLPTISSLIGLGAALGYSTASLSYFNWFHANEEKVMIFSAIALFIGAVSQFISWRIDCHNTGCEHGSCEPKKNYAFKVFIFALILFCINLIVHFYLDVH